MLQIEILFEVLNKELIFKFASQLLIKIKQHNNEYFFNRS